MYNYITAFCCIIMLSSAVPASFGVCHKGSQRLVVLVDFVIHFCYTGRGDSRLDIKNRLVTSELQQKGLHILNPTGNLGISLPFILEPHRQQVLRVMKLFPEAHHSLQFSFIWKTHTDYPHSVEHSPHVLAHLQEALYQRRLFAMVVLFVWLAPVFNHGHSQVVNWKWSPGT